MGKQLSAAAYATPPIVPEGVALAVVVVSVMLMVFSTSVMALRVYARAFAKKGARGFGWEDMFAVLSWVSLMRCSCLGWRYTWTHHSADNAGT